MKEQTEVEKELFEELKEIISIHNKSCKEFKEDTIYFDRNFNKEDKEIFITVEESEKIEMLFKEL